MGRKKQTYMYPGCTSVDPMSSTMDFMMGRTDTLALNRETLIHQILNQNIQIISTENQNTKYESGTTPAIIPLFNKNENLQDQYKISTENYKSNQMNCPQESQGSFNFNGSISDLELEGLESDDENDCSIREEGQKESIGMLEDTFELEIVNDSSSDEDLVFSEVEGPATLDTDLDNENNFDTKNVINFEILKELDKDKIIAIPTESLPIKSFNSFDSIKPKTEMNFLDSEDKESLENLIKTFNEFEISGDDIENGASDLNVNGLDHKYEFERSFEPELNEYLRKRNIPHEYNWNLFLLKTPKKIKDQLIYVEPNILHPDDNFFHLLIDRYRTN